MIENTLFFGVTISLLSFALGNYIFKKTKLAIFNPLLLAIIFTIIFLLIFNIDYEKYNEGAKYLSYLLTPATICLAIPLYEKINILKKNVKAILASVLSSVIITCLVILTFTLIFKLSYIEYVSFLPKSITTAIGMDVSKELRGNVNLTVAIIIITGVIGNIVAPFICKIFKIKSPVAKGLAIGCSSHAVGTAKALEMGEIEGALSSLSIVVSGLLTVVIAPLFASIL